MVRTSKKYGSQEDSVENTKATHIDRVLDFLCNHALEFEGMPYHQLKKEFGPLGFSEKTLKKMVALELLTYTPAKGGIYYLNYTNPKVSKKLHNNYLDEEE